MSKCKFIILVSSIFFIFLYVPSVFAESSTNTTPTISDQVSSFRQFRIVAPIIPVTSVVEVPMEDVEYKGSTVAVLDNISNKFVPWTSADTTQTKEIPIQIKSDMDGVDASRMIDNDRTTSATFPLTKEGENKVTFYITAGGSKFTASSFTLSLDTNVIRPKTVEVRAYIGVAETIILYKSPMNSNRVVFPQTTSDHWRITFTYDQPLRITELSIPQIGNPVIYKKAVRFLAQPNHSYVIYFDENYPTNPHSREDTPNLMNAKDAVVVIPLSPQQNPYFKPLDTDNDGRFDWSDNCPTIPNADQLDKNQNQIGDFCEDFDYDAIVNNIDNCPDDPNRDQVDSDSDGIGDVCDATESRFTEANPWVPWVGIVAAALVLIILFAMTAKEKTNRK